SRHHGCWEYRHCAGETHVAAQWKSRDSVVRYARVDLAGPGLDAADDVVHDAETLLAEMLGGARTRVAVMAEEGQRRFLRQLDQALMRGGIEDFGTGKWRDLALVG